MKIGENNVKCGKIIIIDHKFYLKTTNCPSNFLPTVGILSKKFVLGLGFLNQKCSGPGISRGGVATGQGDTCITAIQVKQPEKIDQ